MFGAPLSNGEYAVMVYNNANRKYRLKFELELSTLGLKGPVLARDLWLHKDLGTFTDKIPIKSVEPHGVVVFRLKPIKNGEKSLKNNEEL